MAQNGGRQQYQRQRKPVSRPRINDLQVRNTLNKPARLALLPQSAVHEGDGAAHAGCPSKPRTARMAVCGQDTDYEIDTVGSACLHKLVQRVSSSHSHSRSGFRSLAGYSC